MANFLTGLLAFFAALFDKLPNWVERIMPDIFKFTTALREALEKGDEWLKSQTAETIVTLIPGDLDDSVRRTLLLILEQAIPIVSHIEDTEQTFGNKLLAFLISLQGDTEKGKKAKLMALASTMLQLHDNGKLPNHAYDTLAQIAYSKLVAKE